MLSRVAAVKAPRTHNRRRVTGFGGRRREGRESEPHRPNMSRRVFTSAVLLLLLFVMMCCGGAATAVVESNADASNSGSAVTGDITAEGSTSGGFEELQRVDLFAPQTTQVQPKTGTDSGRRDSFVSPSLVSAGGVIAAFAEGHMNAKKPHTESTKPSSDVVAGYIDSAWEWPTVVDEVNKETWRAHTVLGKAEGEGSLDVVRHPTTAMKGNKVFLLVGSTALSYVNGSWKEGSLELKLVVGEVTKPSGGEPSGWIEWGDPKPLPKLISSASHKGNLTDYIASGGSGILMEDGTIVFSLMAVNKENEVEVYSMIIYSKNNGSTWSLSKGISPAKCGAPRITEWEGSLLMIVDCENDQRVYESCDVGTKWTEAVGTLPGVWVNSQSEDYPEGGLHVDALITATIGKRKVMLYTQRGYAIEGETENANPLYLWVTDNNRSFFVGPVGMGNAGEKEVASTLLYSDGKLHLLQRRGNGEHSVVSLSRLTEELKEIESVLSTWAQKDVFFSSLSIPTAGLVAVFSNASANNETWNDEYLCLNATVTNAKKVKDGFQLTEPNSGVLWFVNTRDDNVRHVSLSHNFTLVASVTIEEAPTADAPLLTAVLLDAGPPYIMRLSYTADNKWETMPKGETKPTTESRPWVPKKEHQVALMLQGNKASVYIDDHSLGEEEAPLTGEKPLELFGFCFGACDFDGDNDGEEEDSQKEASQKEIGKKPRVTVTNVFLYNRPLNSTEMRAIKDRIPVSTRAPEPQVKIAPKPVAPAAPAVPGPGELPAAPGRTTVGRTANTQHAPAGRLTSAGNEGTAREKGDGGANGDAGSAYGRELLPLLLLLGLWGFATA
ncbi:putative trans-sialidase, Group II [Trypanosoma cruzi]|uniref:Trans-sialidase, putative n=2 Tax=Trypanosoma cruzi TaxID=5693 RepID=Q4DKB6_TRYCC|nr:trans-sialidase, putative [Trypanosoma cruzi]EAN92967.1 trans-sialidase, putative [Trypanosoma cruzi]PWV04784.1 putative trans-sialidase, Group II [Trypanosoma cruzi]RNC46358.1 trans-sialidase-like protein [Trypanosoma cruzi]|eukprot:XP_814818.1 trans-sialidase [Trypanosoma cruzi strain CL Brener]